MPQNRLSPSLEECMKTIPLVLTYKHECNYLDDEIAQSAFVHPSIQIDNSLYSELIELGFRRSGNDVYKPRCPACKACIPAKIPVKSFAPNRQQKRCLKKHSQTRVITKPAHFEQTHYDLYLRYQNRRHQGGIMAQTSPNDYITFLSSDWSQTQFVEFLIDNRLAGVAIIDLLDNGISAVYTFFEPDLADYSLGTYAVLWQIEQAKKLLKDFIYLGFWIENCRKMAYKNQFQPLQLFINDSWLPYLKTSDNASALKDSTVKNKAMV